MTGNTTAQHSAAGPTGAQEHVVGPFEALGHNFEVRCDDAALADLLDHLYAPMRHDAVPTSAPTPPTATAPDPVVYRIKVPTDETQGWVERDGTRIGSSRRRARVFGYLQWAINRGVIQTVARDRLVLHAAAAARDGTVVVLPAAMESGKTTLVTGLLDRGFTYLTDEAAAIDADLQVHGYAKPLSIDPGSWDVHAQHRPTLPDELDSYFADQWQVAPHSIGQVARQGPLGLLVFPRYEPDTATVCTRLRPSEVVATATGCTFGADGDQMGLRHVRALAAIAEAVPAYQLVSSDLEQACDAIIERLP